MKKHYDTKHVTKYDMIQGQLRIDKLASSMKNKRSVFKFKKNLIDSEVSVKASYIIVQKMSTKSKPFMDGEFIEECIEAASGILSPAQKLFFKLSLSRVTVSKRIQKRITDIESSYPKITPF
jgi:hypothetical protein